MQYDVVRQSLETFIQSGWTETPIQFDNVPFDSDALSEYVSCTVLFGDSIQTTVNPGYYRQIGLLTLTVNCRPATGTARLMTLAASAGALLTSAVVQPPEELDAPTVQFQSPHMATNLDAKSSGWVSAQVGCPFYYDLES